MSSKSVSCNSLKAVSYGCKESYNTCLGTSQYTCDELKRGRHIAWTSGAGEQDCSKYYDKNGNICKTGTKNNEYYSCATSNNKCSNQPTKTTPGKTPTTTTKPAPQSQGLTCSNGTLNTDDFDIKKYNGGQFSKSEKTGNGWDTQNQSLCRKNMCIKWPRDTSDGKNRIYSCTVPEGQQPSNVSESCCSEYAKKIGYKYQTRSWNDIPTGCVKSVNPGAKDVWFNTNANPSCIGKGEGCEGKTTTKGTFTVVSDEMTDCKKKHKGHRGNKGSDNINIVIANSGGGSPDQPPHEYIDPLNYTSNPPGPLNQNPDGGSGNDNTDDQSGDSGQTPPSQTPPSQTPSGSTSSSVVVNPPPKSSNTLLYVGIGVVVLLLLLFLLYRFYKKRGLSGQPIAPPITQPIRSM